MENKYYVPDISEFHVGFEYEEYNEYRKEWCKHILSEENIDKLGSFWYPFLESEHRVKYLDKEDIESLGFKDEEKKDMYGHDLYSKDIELGVNTGNIITIKHSAINGYLWISRKSYGSYGENEDQLPFVIKNKSELKKVLEMIGVD